MTKYEQKPPQIDAAFWDGADTTEVAQLFEGAEADGETLMVPNGMGGMMPVPKDSYVIKDQWGNVNWSPKDTFEASYEEVTA